MMYLELQKTGVTRMFLWQEYYNKVRAAGKISLQYSQFCNYFNQYIERNKATMHFDHKIAERIEVDWLCKDSHNQSTIILSPGLCVICIVRLFFFT